MRVALVNSLFRPYERGGAARSVRELAQGLASQGHQVRVHTLAPHDIPAERGIDYEVRRFTDSRSYRPFMYERGAMSKPEKVIWHLSEARRVGARGFLETSFADFRPDVVHTNNIAGFGLAAWSAAGTLPLVHTMRDYYLVCARSSCFRDGQECTSQCRECALLRAAVRHPARRPDVFVGVSQFVLDKHIQGGYLRPSDRVELVLNYPAPASLAIARTIRRPSAAVRVGVLGRIGRDKGTWTVMDALSELSESARGRTALVVAGGLDDSDRATFEGYLARNPNVRYLGSVSPQEFFSQIDVLVAPAQWPEPFGRTVAEAGMAGVPVIASNVGGLGEAVGAFGGGVMVDDYRSPAAWARALESVTESIRKGDLAAAPAPATRNIATEYEAVYRAAGATDQKNRQQG